MDEGFSNVLEGVKVVELGSGEAASFCGHILASLGANVVAVRNPSDTSASPEAGLDVLKRCLVLDRTETDFLNRVRGICRDADLLIEELDASESRRAGLSPLLRDANHALTCACISPFGLTGSLSTLSGFPLNCYHAGGHAQQLPFNPLWPEYRYRAPVQACEGWGDAQCGVFAALALLAGRLGGEAYQGALIDVSKQEVLLNLNWTEVVRFPNENKTVSRLTPHISFVGGILPARDGYVQLVIMEEHQWQAAMQLFGHPEWANEDGLQTQRGRCQSCDRVAAFLAAETLRFSRDEFFRRGQEYGLAVAPVLTLTEVLDDPAIALRHGWRTMMTSDGGEVRVPRSDAWIVTPSA